MRAMREKTGLTQTQFWAPLGVTQSAGSRYETGRSVPKAVATLVTLAYGKKPLAALAKLRNCKVADLA